MRSGLLGLVLLAGACAPAAQPGPPEPSVRIASLNPCTDAVLAEVADPGRIAALSAYSRDPASSSMDVAVARRFAATSGTVEELVHLRPTLVIGGTFTSPATRAALADLGIPLVELPIAQTVEQSTAQVRQIARLAGNGPAGEALVARIEAALSAAAPADPDRPTALVWQSGGIVAGEDSLIADLLRRTGFSGFAAARGLRQADYLPLETVLADPPRVLLAAVGTPSGEDRLLVHPALAALGDTHRARLDPALLWCGGPTIIRAAARLAEVRRAMMAGEEGLR